MLESELRTIGGRGLSSVGRGRVIRVWEREEKVMVLEKWLGVCDEDEEEGGGRDGRVEEASCVVGAEGLESVAGI